MPFDIGGTILDSTHIYADGASGIVKDNLILHYDSSRPDSYPGSGSTWYDISGNNYDATLYNSVTFTNHSSLQTRIGDERLNFTLVDHALTSHPTNESGLDSLFTNGTNVTTGLHEGAISFGNQGQTIRWGGTVGGYPSYWDRSVPNSSGSSNYGWKVEGYIFLPETGTYAFHIDGDDAMDFFINGTKCAYWYGGHGFNYQSAGGTGTSQSFNKGWYSFEARFEEIGGGDGIAVGWRLPSTGGSSYSTIPGNAFSSYLPKSTKRTLRFDRSQSQYANGPHNSALSLSGDMTLECWFIVYNDNVGWVRVVGKGTHPAARYGLWYHGTAGHLLWQRYDGPSSTWMNIQQSSSLQLNTWYHMVGVSSGTTHTLYINGSSVGSGTSLSSFSTDTAVFQVSAGGSRHEGEIADVKVYNAGLTSTQVLQNYNAQKARFGL